MIVSLWRETCQIRNARQRLLTKRSSKQCNLIKILDFSKHSPKTFNLSDFFLTIFIKLNFFVFFRETMWSCRIGDFWFSMKRFLAVVRRANLLTGSLQALTFDGDIPMQRPNINEPAYKCCFPISQEQLSTKQNILQGLV